MVAWLVTLWKAGRASEARPEPHTRTVLWQVNGEVRILEIEL